MITNVKADITTNTKYYDYWSNFDYNKIIEDINNTSIKNIVILGENEFYIWAPDEFVNLVNKKNISVKFITGCVKTDAVYSQSAVRSINNCKIEFYPEYHFSYCNHQFSNAISNQNYFKLHNENTLSYPFVCFMNRPHLHRIYVIEQIAKNQLLDKGVVTWNDFANELEDIKKHQNFSWKYYDGKKITVNDNFLNSSSSTYNMYSLSNEYFAALFDFVLESSYELIGISEKTIRPLAYKKPFLVLGAVGFNKYLKQLGFKWYDEVFDYTFDNELDLETRCTLFVENIKLVSNIKKLSKTYKRLREKINYNYEVYKKMTDYKNHRTPIEIKKVLPFIQSNANNEELGVLEKYRSIFKLRGY